MAHRDIYVASEHLLLFRSAATGFCDLDRDSGTGNLGGFRSSCTTNLIAAGGVLSVPDYTLTCTCPYQNQTSLALVHDPDDVGASDTTALFLFALGIFRRVSGEDSFLEENAQKAITRLVYQSPVDRYLVRAAADQRLAG